MIHPSQVSTLKYTGERLVPGMSPSQMFREHEARYAFAGKFVKDKTVVDVACASGIGTDLLRSMGARHVIGVDIDYSAIEYAKRIYNQCSFVRSDGTKMCLDDASADLVISFETLEHISDATRFLRECKRILTPNGVLICSTPNRTVNRWTGPNRFHVREVRPDEFAAMLGELFVDIQLYSQSEVTYPTFVLKRCVIELLRLAGVKEVVRKVFEPRTSMITQEMQFKEVIDREYEIRPYLPHRLRRPTYVISVSRKAE